jgi:hypothetical protein
MAMADPEKRIEFLVRLMRLTEEGKLEWTAGKDEFWFKTEMSRFTYTVNSEDKDDVAPFAFSIYRRGEGKGPLEKWEWLSSGNETVNPYVRDLYFLVKRKIVGYDNLLEGMFQDLSDAEGA